jgi:hypothetical protein
MVGTMAETRMEITVILPEEMNIPGFIKPLLARGVKEMGIAEAALMGATRTWRRQPVFKRSVGLNARDFRAAISTSSKPFLWVEQGTRIRWRRLSPNWRSKSKPRSLEALPGAGRPTGFYKRARPGIKARDFRVVVAEIRNPVFAKDMRKLMTFAANSLFKTGKGRRVKVRVT